MFHLCKLIFFLFLSRSLISAPIGNFKKSLIVVTYNVENLFDAKPTSGHLDGEYLPMGSVGKEKCKLALPQFKKKCLRLDWTDEKVVNKVSQHGKVLKSLTKEMGSPDILVVNEIETNDLLLELKRATFQKPSDYNIAITSGQDRRGIQTGLLLKKTLSIQYIKEHELPFKTRNILEVMVKHGQTNLIIFAVHFPSQRAKTKVRNEVTSFLISIISKRKRDTSKSRFIVLGDFNTLDREHPNPLTPLKEIMVDSTRTSDFSGTYFYKKEMAWNFLDRIFIDKQFTILESTVFRPDFIQGVVEYRNNSEKFYGTRILGVPKRFEHQRKYNTGFSDHFPLVVKLAVD